jgi:hypothetical protein
MFWWNTIKQLEQNLQIAVRDKEMYKKRCIDIEDSVEQDYGVKTRNEVTEIKVDFTSDELAIMLYSIVKMMSKEMSTGDLEYYLKLRIKIEDLLNKMN